MDHPTLQSLDLVAAVDAMPHPGWLCDRRGRMIHANERWVAYLGGESRLRRHWLTDRFVHPHDIATVRQAWRAALESGDVSVRARLRRLDDTWHWHLLRAAPVGPDDDPRAAWLGTWTDVDDVVGELESAHVRARLLEATVEASLDATILASPDRVLVWANRRAYELWGADPARFPPGTDLRLAGELVMDRVRDPERNRAVLEAMYADPTRVLRDELEFVDGRIVDRYSSPVVDADGEVIGRMNTYRDITAQRRTMDELSERAHASMAIDHVADAVFLVDDHDILHIWNPAAELLTGIRAREAIDRRIDDVLVDWHRTRELVPVLEDPDEPREAATVPIGVSGGREAWVSAVGVRFAGGTVYALRDVTDDERLDRMRSDIVATVSHELRTPLTSIYGMAITLHDDEARLDHDTRRRLLSTIVEQSARLGSLLDDILVANGLDAGTVALRPQPLDVHEVVRTAIDLVTSGLQDPAPISVEFDPDLPLVAADADRVQQVVVNLLENAIKYSPEGGPVHVRARHCPSAEVAIDVIDHGLGIPPGELERVFEKFHRLDPGMSLGIAGTGLGLYIARELVRRMHGDLVVRSIEGVGSTFTVTLPAA